MSVGVEDLWVLGGIVTGKDDNGDGRDKKERKGIRGFLLCGRWI